MPIKASQQEEEYFARQEFARCKQDLAAHESRAAETERLRVLALAKDRCPTPNAAHRSWPSITGAWRWTRVPAARVSGWSAASWTRSSRRGRDSWAA